MAFEGRLRHIIEVAAERRCLGAPRARPAEAERGTGPPRAMAQGGPGDEVPPDELMPASFCFKERKCAVCYPVSCCSRS